MMVPFDPHGFDLLTHDTATLARVGECMDRCAAEAAGHLHLAARDLKRLDAAETLASLRRLAAFARDDEPGK